MAGLTFLCLVDRGSLGTELQKDPHRGSSSLSEILVNSGIHALFDSIEEATTYLFIAAVS